MLPSTTSSQRLVLENRTNLFHTTPQPKLKPFLATSPEDKIVRRHAAILDGGSKKRLRVEFEDRGSEVHHEFDDSDVEMEDVAVVRARSRKLAPFQRNTVTAMRYRLENCRQPDSKYFYHQISACSSPHLLISVYSSNTTVVRLLE